MSEIVIKPIDSKFYQPNIVIAIFLCLYKSEIVKLSKKHIGTYEVEFHDFIDKLINSVKIYKSPYLYGNYEELTLISKEEDNDNITLFIDKNKHTGVNKNKVSYTKHFSRLLKKYLTLLKTDNLHDEVRNMPSWETISSNFINEIDKTCNLKDYKIFDLKHIQAITYYKLNNELGLTKIELEPMLNNSNDILKDSSWNIKITLSLKNFFKFLNYHETKPVKKEPIEPIKYSARELEVIILVHDSMEEEGCKIAPEDILDTLNPDWRGNPDRYKNPKKYVSNFISRLNKKCLHNTGHKLFDGKDFKDCYFAYNYHEEIEEF